MSKTRYRWMLFIVLVLLTSNIILAFMLTGFSVEKKTARIKPEDKVSTWYKDVALSNEQIDTFQQMKQEYFRVMKPIWNEIRVLKDSLYLHLDKTPDDSTVNNYLELISQKNLFADRYNFVHFSKLRKMCTADQQVRFDTIIPKMLNRPWSRAKK